MIILHSHIVKTVNIAPDDDVIRRGTWITYEPLGKTISNHYPMNKIGPLLTRLRARFIGRSSPPPNSISLENSKVDSMPYTLPFGILKLFVVTTSSIGFGAFLAKEVAKFLRNNKIFVPKKDDG